MSGSECLVEEVVTGKKGMLEADTRDEKWVFLGGSVGGEEMGEYQEREGPVPALSVRELDCCSRCSAVLCAPKMV